MYYTIPFIFSGYAIIRSMPFKKFRWSKDYEAAEEELEMFLDSRGHDLTRYEIAADTELPVATSAASRQLWCAEGSIQLTFDSAQISLQPGDGVTIDAGQTHSGHSGVAGCVWYEQ